MNIVYGIASYHRPECRTYAYLKKLGVKDDNILIALNDPQDYAEYARRMPKARLRVRAGNSAAFNRNTLLEEIKAPCVLLDDDIINMKCLRIVDGKRNYNFTNAKSLEELELFLTDCFAQGVKNGAKIFGTCATTHGAIATSNYRNWGGYTPDVMIQGTVTGIIDSTLRYDESYRMVEDYELSCRIIAQNSHTLRCNLLSADKPTNGTNAGGLHELYARGEQPYWLTKLCRHYSQIVRMNKQKTGVLMRL